MISFCLLLFFSSEFLLSFGTSPSTQHLSSEKQVWIEGSQMPTPRTEISAALLDGKIYIVGGQTKRELTNIVEAYDPSTDQWITDLAPLPIALDHSALVGYKGKLYLVGGFLEREKGQDRRPTDSLFIYDPVTNKWQKGEPVPTARAGLAAEFINGTLYAIGGSTGDNEGQVNINEAYDPETNTWTEKAPMPTARHHITSIVVDGKIYVIGGRETDIPTSLNVNEMYEPLQDRWIKLEPMPTKRSSVASGYIDGSIYVFGGEKEKGSFDTNERYNIRTNTWSEAMPMPTPRLGLDAADYNDKIYVIGGKESQPNRSSTGVNEIFYTEGS